MVYIRDYIFNKDVYVQFNSTVGKFVGYTEHGVYNAELLNNNPSQLQSERAQVEICKQNADVDQQTITDKSGKQHKILISHDSHKTLVLNAYTRHF